jgi:hypothetical protein
LKITSEKQLSQKLKKKNISQKAELVWFSICNWKMQHAHAKTPRFGY